MDTDQPEGKLQELGKVEVIFPSVCSTGLCNTRILDPIERAYPEFLDGRVEVAEWELFITAINDYLTDQMDAVAKYSGVANPAIAVMVFMAVLPFLNIMDDSIGLPLLVVSLVGCSLFCAPFFGIIIKQARDRTIFIKHTSDELLAPMGLKACFNGRIVTSDEGVERTQQYLIFSTEGTQQLFVAPLVLAEVHTQEGAVAATVAAGLSPVQFNELSPELAA